MNINVMTIDELKKFLGIPGNNRICQRRGCYNNPDNGYIFCLRCLHGTSSKVDNDDLILAKKRLEKLSKWKQGDNYAVG